MISVSNFELLSWTNLMLAYMDDPGKGQRRGLNSSWAFPGMRMDDGDEDPLARILGQIMPTKKVDSSKHKGGEEEEALLAKKNITTTLIPWDTFHLMVSAKLNESHNFLIRSKF